MTAKASLMTLTMKMTDYKHYCCIEFALDRIVWIRLLDILQAMHCIAALAGLFLVIVMHFLACEL